jgi:hypothetical protein
MVAKRNGTLCAQADSRRHAAIAMFSAATLVTLVMLPPKTTELKDAEPG